MQKYTLLEIVQSVLTAMDSDIVTAYNETDEAESVVQIAKDVYFRMMTEQFWKHLRKFTQLTALADASHPNYYQIPDGIEDIEVFRYNIKEDAADADDFQEITYIEDIHEFLAICQSRNSTDTNVDTITDFGGADLLIRNDKIPTYWTTFDDTYIILDSWLETLDATVLANKSQIVGLAKPTWTESDVAVPDMPGKFFPAYLEEVKSVCFADLKQMSSIHTQKAAGSKTTLSQRNTITNNPRGLSRKPRYGRR